MRIASLNGSLKTQTTVHSVGQTHSSIKSIGSQGTYWPKLGSSVVTRTEDVKKPFATMNFSLIKKIVQQSYSNAMTASLWVTLT